MPTKKAEKAIVGACGEHYVAAYLSRHELVVALPRAGVKGSDLFVANPDSGFPIRIQAKTARDATGRYKRRDFYSWDTTCPSQNFCNDATWYAYVSLKDWPTTDGAVPEVFFIPSADVRKQMIAVQSADAGDKPAWSRTFFWMYADEIIQYKGEAGFAKLKIALSGPALG
jgi:hypothetical protein